MYLIFDTETTGLPKRWDAPITDTDNWQRCIQIAWQLHDAFGKVLEHDNFLIKPDGFNIPFDAEQVHGISTELAQKEGENLTIVLEKFNQVLAKTKFIVGQNVEFDINIMGCEFYRNNIQNQLTTLLVLDTCTEKTAELCKLSGGRGGKFKLPTLTELHEFLFNEKFEEAHNATADVEATTRCFFELIRLQEFTKEALDVDESYFKEFSEANTKPIQLIGLEHINLKKQSEKLKKKQEKQDFKSNQKIIDAGLEQLTDISFAHLHNHTQFSVLQSTIQIANIVNAAAKDGMSAVAMTDTGNMMAAFQFVSTVLNHNKANNSHLKPIVGCEFYMCENHLDKANKDNGYQIVMLAKNKNGYHNLAKMSSIAFVDGFYYVPRIDK
ncbi:MAG: PHP domain-containing protein, partial [Polaribacter sp.]|nr:PHP domain-containing protein [Polaribacter sp.]